jgi:hypothetical protein
MEARSSSETSVLTICIGGATSQKTAFFKNLKFYIKIARF